MRRGTVVGYSESGHLAAPCASIPGVDRRVAYHRPSCPMTMMSDRSGSPRLIAVVAGIAGLLLCAVVPLLPVKQTTATILWPQGTSADGHVIQVTAPLVSGAPRALDISVPCSAIATLPPEGGLVVSTLPTGGRGCRQKWPLRARQQGHDRGRLPRLGRGGGTALGRRRRCVQRAARLGRRRRRGGGVRRHTRGRRDPFRREEASGRRDLHRPEGARPTRAVGTHRHRHPVHHGAHGDEEDRDGPRRTGCPGRHPRAGRDGSAQPRGDAGQLALPDRLAQPGTARS